MAKAGKDTQIGMIALERELLNARQMKHCRSEWEARCARGESIGIGEVMVQLGYLTEKQLKALRSATRKRQCRIRGYEIASEIGRGSVGAVYHARQIAMDRDVAIKILRPELADKPDVVKAYINEARSVAKLNHPHIVQGIDVGESDGFYYFAMEYLPGGTFADRLEREVLQEEDALVYLYQVASALKHAREREIIHCDIKPANLMLDSAGRVKVTDLGLAQFGRGTDVSDQDAGRVVRGTPHYLSPEQIQTPDDLDCRTDVYSLGATFYHLLSGRTPFSGKDNKTIILKRLRSKPKPLTKAAPGVSRAMSDLIASMMERDRAKRPQSPDELMDILVTMGVDMRRAGDVVGAFEQSRASRRKPTGRFKATPYRKRTTASRERPSRAHRLDPSVLGSNHTLLIAGVALVVLLALLALAGILAGG